MTITAVAPTVQTAQPVMADTALFTFYDIESLANVFSFVGYTPFADGTGEAEVFYLVDDAPDGTNLADRMRPKDLGDTIFASNPGLPAFPTTNLRFYDLREPVANVRLAQVIGLSDAQQVCHRNDPSSYPDQLRPVCDTDPEYDPRAHPFLAGYNSMNYDTTMLALYLNEVFPNPRVQPMFQPTSARTMRAHNDRLFSEHIEYMPGALGWDSPAGRIRRAMMHSGRHLDVGRLNELQFKVSLKRLLGMLGRQIKESEKLSHDTTVATVDDLCELLAYNVSDCLGLAQLFRHPAYANSFDLKAGLLDQFRDTVFAASGAVRRDRLTIDSSSAKFVGRILAPDKPLQDIEAVSFMYPHPEIAREQGTTPVNVLDECVRFFEETVCPDPAQNPHVTAAQRAAHEQFMQVVRYYRSIEGKNFNDSETYKEVFSNPVHVLGAIPKTPNNVPYFHADGTPSSCFATFSTGGIHGVEADIGAFTLEQDAYEEQVRMLARARAEFPEAADFLAEAKRQHNLLTLPDGSTVDKRLVLHGSDPEKVKYRKPKKDDTEQAEQLDRAQALLPEPADLLAAQRDKASELDVTLPDGTVLSGKVVLANTTAANAAYRTEPPKKQPALFTPKEDGSNKLHPKFVRTSAGLVIHEDFTSYYPNLLRNMRAFYNPDLGEDRYAQIFFDKECYGREMKQPGISPEEKTRLNNLRNGTKLILNSASGAGDAGHDTPIRMNNQIISMRIIGQLFSWRIGQAQARAGARIISTNTDGLYSILDWKTNNEILAEQSAAIGVEIEPEPLFLISKDSNNRLELEAPEAGRTIAESPVISAGGGTLACHAGPTPTKSLAHPAVIDFALARYLQTVAGRGEEALAEPFDPVLGKKVIEEAVDPADPVKTLMMFQNVLAASRSSITYPFAAEPVSVCPEGEGDAGADADSAEGDLVNPRPLQMVNRVFIVRDGTMGAVSLHNAGAWKVPAASQAKRIADNQPIVKRLDVPMRILRHHGWAQNQQEASTQSAGPIRWKVNRPLRSGCSNVAKTRRASAGSYCVYR